MTKQYKKEWCALVSLFALVIADSTIVAGEVPDHARSATQMTAAAAAFVETLNDAQREDVLMPLTVDERATWSNLPIIMVHPDGLLVGDMNETQMHAFHELLRASLSSQGYAKLTGIMWLDDYLYETGLQRLNADPDSTQDPAARAFLDTRSSGNYAVAIFGDPGGENWGWKVAGHHAAANFTVSAGRVNFTPLFMGSSPRVVDSGRYTGWMAMPQEGDRGIELMRALSDEQRGTALVSEQVPDDVFEGPGRRASLDEFEGLSVDELSPPQMRLLQVLVEESLRNLDFDAAGAQLALVESVGWQQLYFSWRGAVDRDGEFYFRVHGPRLLIEYNRQNPNHDHMVVRDPQNDYGEDWLEHHYREHHPSMEEAREAARRRVEASQNDE